MNTLRIYIVGVGGQGNVLASKMIGEAALSMGVPVLMSETHGMAQRGGVVESTVVLGGAQSPTISDNCADILLAFEPMEAVRALSKANADTIVITPTPRLWCRSFPAVRRHIPPSMTCLPACAPKWAA